MVNLLIENDVTKIEKTKSNEIIDEESIGVSPEKPPPRVPLSERYIEQEKNVLSEFSSFIKRAVEILTKGDQSGGTIAAETSIKQPLLLSPPRLQTSPPFVPPAAIKSTKRALFSASSSSSSSNKEEVSELTTSL